MKKKLKKTEQRSGHLCFGMENRHIVYNASYESKLAKANGQFGGSDCKKNRFWETLEERVAEIWNEIDAEFVI